MSWEDHVVECKNKDGKTGKFVFPHHCLSRESNYKFVGLPYGGPKLEAYHVGQPKVWQYNDFSDEWSFNTVEKVKENGWDLRPLEMHEDKPNEKAFLVYNTKKDEFFWFIKNEDAPAAGLFCLKGPNNINHLWRYLSGKQWNHESKEWYEHEGYVFEEESKEMSQNVEVLQQKLIEYCAAKSTRTTHLIRLTNLGALNNSATYDEVAETITDYLNTNQSVCSDGADRAIKALGLGVEKIVVKQMTCAQILNGIRNENKVFYFVDADGEKVTTEHSASHNMYVTPEWLSCINYSTILTVGVVES